MTARPQRARLALQLGLGMLVGIIGLAWAMRGLDLRLVLQGLTSANYGWVLVALASVLAVALTKAARWQALYCVSEERTDYGDLFSTLMITQMVNVLIPVRVGEIVRIGLMKQAGQPGAATLSTIVIEKSLDLLAVGLIALSMVVLSIAPAWFQESSGSVFLIGAVLLVGLAIVWYLRVWMERILARVLAVGGWVPERLQQTIVRVVHTLLQAFGSLTDLRSLIRILFWTTIIWVLSLLTIVSLFAAFDLRVPVAAAVVLMLAISASSLIPSPPALVGVMHAVAVFALGEYGVPQSLALGFGIVLNIVAVGPLVVLGSLALCLRMFSSLHVLRELAWRRIRRDA